MAHRDQRPPRAAPPTRPESSQYGVHSPRAQAPQIASAISFQETERGDRAAPLPTESRRQRNPAYTNQTLNTEHDVEDGAFGPGGRVGRKKSLVRPDRERIDENHRQWHYRSHAAQLDEGNSRVGLMPSSTGNYPVQPQSGLRRGKSLLAREQDAPESGLTLFKRAATLRRKRAPSQSGPAPTSPAGGKSRGCFDNIAPGPKDAWMIYCFLLTCCFPGPLLATCGIRTPDQQRAWREKMGLLAIIGILMAAVGFLTFGFQEVVCGKPPRRFPAGSVDTNSVLIHGVSYNLAKFNHPATGVTFNGTTNPLRDVGLGVAAKDVSFFFQKVNQNCKDLITATNASVIPNKDNNLAWYFPCNPHLQTGAGIANFSGYDSKRLCHTSNEARSGVAYYEQWEWESGAVYYTWDDVKEPTRNLAVYESSVLDLNLLTWLDPLQVNYPPLFNAFKINNGTYNGKDLSMYFYREDQRALGACLRDIVTVGFIDTDTIGCVASNVVLYVSLVFIIGVVAIKFAMAVMFGWFLSWQLGTFRGETYEARMRRAAEIEQWTDDIYRPAPGRYRPNVNEKKPPGKKGIFGNTSRFSKADVLKGSGSRPVTTYDTYKNPRPSTTYGDHKTSRPTTTYSDAASVRKGATASIYGSKLEPPAYRGSRSTTSLANSSDPSISPCPFPLYNVVPQPGPDFQPFNFPLAHTICLVTAYSESIEGLRTTLDSLATTDYPNSHKVILVIADGMVKGSGNDMTTPAIVLSMMKEFIIPPNEVEAHSYVAIADGHKRHNMAKVYAGFYDYDNNTMELSKQQRVPIVLVAKCGNPLEANEAKPGNRGKRDSQIVLMAFLQKVMFDERMTTFEYEFFNSLWRATGVSPDRYEIVLCVDADTKVFPDSLTRMVSCMVDDGEIMGLCGETKIANKGDTWVTMIQVFEYYISHHLTKAFESMFGGVTCLPGCFCMYRIKAPKGDTGYWVPILANPDIVEHYSENIVDTLHKKNLLLLGEDRFLTTLMLKTFPKRKMLFCPQAVCKTIVPDSFGVLLSQRRRWINSTIHNLAELLLVRDLCGTFCFSMQFVVFMELAGTLVLPAAISFTFYLIIVAIKDPDKPIIPLVLLGIILGLPGLLIVVTSRKIAYLGWMFVYLLSLPIWNFVLPAYAFWHFDDFSWGQTRKIIGDKGGNHGDKEGEFDSTHIVMKRWAEFERERRWKNGSHSRDSTYNDLRSGSPNRNRYSLVSAETYADSFPSRHSQPYGGSNEGQDHRGREPLVMLPMPLSVNHPAGSPASSFEASYMVPPDSSSSNQRLVLPEEFPPFQADRNFRSQDPEQEPILSPDAQRNQQSRAPHSGRPLSAVLRNAQSGSPYPGETQNPYRYSQAQEAGYEVFPAQGVEPGELPHPPSGSSLASSSNPPSRGGGVSLVDPGPIPDADGAVRRVARRRPSSQTPPATINPKRFSNASITGSPLASPIPALPSLPPGAAAPRPNSRFE